MALRGSAFLAIWHDIEEHGDVEYDDWHTHEHMPERVGIPGFEAGRRWVDRSLDHHRYFTLYEAATLDVLGSAAYRARLDAPTPWTHKVQPTFTNFVRAACRAVASEGRGTGGALATIRVDFADRGRREPFARASRPLAAEALAHHGITSVHVGIAEPSVTRTPTAESALRELTGEEVFDAVVLVDGIGRAEVEAGTPVDRGGVRAGPWPRPRRRPPSTTWRTRSRRRTSEPRRPAHRLDARPRGHRRPDRAGPVAGGVERALPAERRRRRLRPDEGRRVPARRVPRGCEGAPQLPRADRDDPPQGGLARARRLADASARRSSGR